MSEEGAIIEAPPIEQQMEEAPEAINEVENAQSIDHNTVPENVPTTMIVRQVVIDDESDYEEDEPVGLPYADHNYDTVDPSKRVKDSTVFPILRGLSELGMTAEEEEPALVQTTPEHGQSRVEKVYYEQSPHTIYSNRPREGGVVYRAQSDGARKVLIGGNNYTYTPSTPQTHSIPHGYKAVSRNEFVQSNTAQYVVGGYGSAAGMRRPMSHTVVTPNVTMQKKAGRPTKPTTPGRVLQPPVQAPIAEPPHRAMLTGRGPTTLPPPPTSYQQTTNNTPQQHHQQQQQQYAQQGPEDSMPTPRGGAPLLVAGRGAKPVIRGRAAAAGAIRKREGTNESMGQILDDPVHGGILADEVLHQQQQQQQAPGGGIMGTRPGSPRKTVNFADTIHTQQPGGATMSSANFVVGPPPPSVLLQGSTGVPMPPQPTQEETDRAVDQNVHAIMSATTNRTEQPQPIPTVVRDPVQKPAQPLSPEIRRAMLDGDAATRTLNYHEMVKCRYSMIDIPPDPPAAEPRPRGRPKGSTNRNRLSSLSVPHVISPATVSSQSASSAAAQGGSNPPQGASPRRGSPAKFAQSPQRGVGVRSPSKTSHGDDGDSLTPLIPPTVPSLGAHPPSPSAYPGDGAAGAPMNPSYTPRAVYNIPLTSPPSARGRRKSETKAASEKGDDADASLPLETSNGVADHVASSSAETESEEESDREAESGTDSDASRTTVEEWGDYVTRCNCEMTHTDEQMIQCEKCDVWQHFKCMGINPKRVPETYFCEKCEPRQLKWNSEQAKDYQERQLKLLDKATQKRRQERRKRRDDRRKARERRRQKRKALKKKAAATKPISGLQYKKYNEIEDNMYSDMSRNLLTLYQDTIMADQIIGDLRAAKAKYGRMFVAPSVEGIVAIDDIENNGLVMEFLGQVFMPAECPGREKPGQIQPYTVLYSGLSEQDSLLVIDARKHGGDSRFVRRSCRPNTVLRHVILNGNLHIVLNATESIEKSVEITIPFDSDFRDCHRELQCACGDEDSCPIADFNRKLVPERSPSPVQRKSNGAPPASKSSSSSSSLNKSSKKPSTPSSNAKTPNRSGTTGNKKTPQSVSTSGKRGRPPVGSSSKIRLRRPERKRPTKEEEDDDEESEKEEEREVKEEKEDRKRDQRREKRGTSARKSEKSSPAPSEKSVAESAKSESKRQSKRIRANTDNETGDEGTTVPVARRSPVKQPKAELEEGEIKEEEEGDEMEGVSPRKRTRASTSSKADRDELRRGPPPKRERAQTMASSTMKEAKAEPMGSPRKRRESEKKVEREEMDYTLPEERNKMSREERKLQDEIALIAKLEKEQAHKVSHSHAHPRKSLSPAKDSSAGRRGRPSTSEKEKKERAAEKEREQERVKREAATKKKTAEKEREQREVKKEKEEQQTARGRSVRSSPRSPRKESEREERKEEVVSMMVDQQQQQQHHHHQHQSHQPVMVPEQTRIVPAPPRKRWQQEQEEMTRVEEAQLPSPAREIAPVGKKAWLLRRAQQAEKDEPAPPDPAPTIRREEQPEMVEVRHTISPPLKKRRPVVEQQQEDDDAMSRSEAAQLLAQMAAAGASAAQAAPASMETGKAQSIRQLMVNFARSVVSTGTVVDYSMPEHLSPEDWPAPSQIRKKRVSLDEYKKRQAPGSSSSDQNRKKSFIPNMQSVPDSESSFNLAPVPDPKVLGSPKSDLEELRKRIYGQGSSSSGAEDGVNMLPPPPPEPCLEPPPPPPMLPRSPIKSPPRGSPQKSVTDGESDTDAPRTMSVADRLKLEFGL